MHGGCHTILGNRCPFPEWTIDPVNSPFLITQSATMSLATDTWLAARTYLSLLNSARSPWQPHYKHESSRGTVKAGGKSESSWGEGIAPWHTWQLPLMRRDWQRAANTVPPEAQLPISCCLLITLPLLIYLLENKYPITLIIFSLLATVGAVAMALSCFSSINS